MLARPQFLSPCLIHNYGRGIVSRYVYDLFPSILADLSLCLLVCVTLACTFIVTAARAYSQETSGQILAKLEKLSAESRQKLLVERAKSEKEVMFYSSLQTSDSEPFVRAFTKRYPFLKVNIYRISGQKQVLMIQTEHNAGRNAFDVTTPRPRKPMA